MSHRNRWRSEILTGSEAIVDRRDGHVVLLTIFRYIVSLSPVYKRSIDRYNVVAVGPDDGEHEQSNIEFFK